MNDSFKVERRVALITGVVVIAFVLALVWRNEGFADPNLVVALRIVLSLAVGIVGATIPGFLRLEYTFNGFTIRAAGALALFVITYFGSPNVEGLHLKLQDPEVSMNFKQVDFRTAASFNKTRLERDNAPVVVITAIEFLSKKEPARNATVSRSIVAFSLSGQKHEFDWRYFVNMHREQQGEWLAIKSDAHVFDIEPGRSKFQEILHEPTSDFSWKEFLEIFARSTDEKLVVVQTMDIDNKQHEANCLVNLRRWRSELQQLIAADEKPLSKLTVNCKKG